MEAIRDYVAEDNPRAAQLVLDEIRKTADSLSSFPMLGHTGQRQGIRELVMTRYSFILIYRVMPKTIGIIAIMHHRRHHQ